MPEIAGPVRGWHPGQGIFCFFNHFIIKITLNARNPTWFVRQHRSSSQFLSRWFQKTVVSSAKCSLFEHWGGEISQTENAVTSSSDVKRAYRKDKPLSEAERQRAVFARKRAVCKEIKVFVRTAEKLSYPSVCKGRPDSGRIDRKTYWERGLSPEYDMMGAHSWGFFLLVLGYWSFKEFSGRPRHKVAGNWFWCGFTGARKAKAPIIFNRFGD